MIDRTFYGAATSITRSEAFKGIPVQYTGGIDLDYVIDKRTAKQNVAGVPTDDLGRDEDNIAYNTDAFVQSQWFFNEKYTGLLGARLSRVTLKVEDQFPVSGSNPDSSGRKTYTGLSPVLGLTRHHSSSLNTYVQYGRGFETPTLNEVLYSPPGGSATTNKFYASIDPAKSNQIEIGFKWRPSEILKVDGAFFVAKTKDDIVPDEVNSSGSTWQNADTSRKGVELSALALLSKSTALRFAYTAIDAEYTSNGSASSTRVQDGKAMPGIPRYRVFGDLTWRSAGWLKKPNSTHTETGVELVAVGDTWVNSQNTAQANSYELLNLKASHHIKMDAGVLSFIARLDNVTDEKYVGSVVVDQSQNRFYEPGAPRNWLLGLKYTVQM